MADYASLTDASTAEWTLAPPAPEALRWSVRAGRILISAKSAPATEDGYLLQPGTDITIPAGTGVWYRAIDQGVPISREALPESSGSSGGGGGGGGTTIDREMSTTIWRVVTAVTGGAVGQMLSRTQILDVTAAAFTVSVIWHNLTTGLDLAAAPAIANLELMGMTGLTDAQLRATAVPVTGPLTDAQLRAAALATRIGVTASNGVVIYPDDLTQTLVRDGAGVLTAVEVTTGGTTYRQTLTYTSGLLTSVSRWTAV